MPATSTANTNDLTNPARKSVSVTALSISFRNVTIGIENDCIVTAPPTIPTRSENSTSSGVISKAAMIRGVTRKRTGLKPIVVSASTSWLTRIVPISAANAAPERPASRIAVISGPSSRSIDRPIRSATKISAPKRFIGTADWNARIMPSRNEISATIGSASAPTCSQIRQTSLQRTLRGWRAAKASAATVSPMNSSCVRMSRQTPYAAKPTSSIAGRRGGSGSRSCASTVGIELLQQRGIRGVEVRDLDLALARLAQEIDEQRDAGAVAVFDARRVDHQRTARGVRRRAPRGIPKLGQRRRVEAARQRERAPAIGGVVDRERRHASARPEQLRALCERLRCAVVEPERYSTSSRAVPATRTRSPSRTNGS